MSIGKQGAHVGQAVDVGCLGLGVSAEATDPVVQVVDGDKQDVRLPLGPEGKAWEGKKEGKEKVGCFHKIESGLFGLFENGFEVLLDEQGVLGRDLVGFGQRLALAHGALVPDFGQLGISICPHALVQEHHHAFIGIEVRILEGWLDGEEVDDLLSLSYERQESKEEENKEANSGGILEKRIRRKENPILGGMCDQKVLGSPLERLD